MKLGKKIWLSFFTASEQQLKAMNQQLQTANQQLQASEQQLRATNQQLNAGNQQLQVAEQQIMAANQRLRANEEQLRRVNHDMNERVKELNCLYELSQLVERDDMTLEEIFQGLAELIPLAWQYPEIAATQVTFEGRRFKTNNFRKTAWIQSADIKVHGQKSGIIEVCQLKKKPVIDDGPLLTAEGKLLSALAERIGKIAERKQAAKKLAESKQLYQTLVENIDLGITLIDADHRIVMTNNGQGRLFNKSNEQFVGKYCFKEFEKRDAVCSHCPGTRTMATGLAAEVETEGVRDDGSRFSVHISAFPVFDKNGKANRFIEVVEDITERKKDEKALRWAKIEADAANQAKSRFLANMSHEIRTPMNAITGFADLLTDGELTEQQRDYVNTIRKSGQNLLALIDNILDLSKIEAGKLNVEILDSSLANILNSIESTMRPKAIDEGIDFEVVESKNLPAQIRTDPTRLLQCLINLVSNAIKFTKQGYVHVNVSLQTDDTQPYIHFDVEDTGIGIPLDKQEKVFESFKQADESTTRKYGGTGLGLAITKQLVELLGGELTLTSEIGKGAVFSIIIPAGLDIAKQPLLDRFDIADNLDSRRDALGELRFSGKVLVAEDVKTNQMLIKRLLEKSGFEVTVVKDGNEAMQKALTHKFDLILMDIQMPNMNGYEATKALRKQGIKTPIIALTAYAMKGDDKKCIAAGCDEYLTKPIDRRELLKTISKYLPAKELASVKTADSGKS